MNLAWLAAVLRPQDLRPVLAFPDTRFGPQGPARLAAIVLGEHDRLRQRVEAHGIEFDWNGDMGLTHAQAALTTSTVLEGLVGLKEDIRVSEDPARACALGLVACTAAAELDDYESVTSIIVQLLDRVPGRGHADRLIRAAVLQQSNLRQVDMGMRKPDLSGTVAELLNSVDIGELPDFDLLGWSPDASRRCATAMVAALRAASASLVLRDPRTAQWVPPAETADASQDWDPLAHVDVERARVYQRYVADAFDKALRSRKVSLVAPPLPDLFGATLGLELLGHRDAIAMRRDQAVLRLLQVVADGMNSTADVLRLLRHARAESELALVLERLRAEGPLFELAADARQILLNRTPTAVLRDVELRVLHSAADLLSPGEATRALNGVLAVAKAGGTPPEPFGAKLPSVRLEWALMAAGELANTAGNAEPVAQLLLAILREYGADERDVRLADVVARAAFALDWATVDADTVSAWREWRATAPDSLRQTADVIDEKLGTTPGTVQRPIQGLMDAAARLNSLLRGNALPEDDLRRAAEIARAAMSETRKAAAEGRFALQALTAADVAAGLIAYGRVTDLWGDLAQLLLDPLVYRDSKTPALERLARDMPSIPDEIRMQFHVRAGDLLRTPALETLSPDTLIPYPSALRFAAVYGIMDTPEVVVAVSMLTVQRTATGPEEAARTVALLAKHTPDLWLGLPAIELSSAADVTVRGYASTALVHLAAAPTFAGEAAKQLVRLLNEDGILVPVVAIRELMASGTTPPRVVNTLQELMTDHPSRTVRELARAAMAAPLT